MNTSMKNRMKRIAAVLLLICMLLPQFSAVASAWGADALFGPNSIFGNSLFNKVTDSIQSNIEQYFDSQQVYQLPAGISDEEEISVLVMVDSKTLLEVYTEKNTTASFGEFSVTEDAKEAIAAIADKNQALIDMLNQNKVAYSIGERYDTLVSGFEINIKAGDFKTVGTLLSDYATLIVGDVYLPAATEIVENEVDVYETGIFDSSMSEHQGDGVVVAVLDTGLDYTHTAFSVDNFTTSKEAFTLSSIAGVIGGTAAAGFTANLTANDVYVSAKVPFAYDYADKDSDVFPINSDHGTHVAGVIAGSDDMILGVAPNAQLAIMKVFSDFSTGAKTSWLIAALEDCVALGVDVINMSLGSSCGFAREVDKQNINEIYDSIKAAGISLITAASNDNNATAGSEKNGSNPLTQHPDSGTVGSPSTYDASLSVGSVDGVKTPYLLFNSDIMYFTEANTSAAKTKDFVEDILKTVGNPDSYDFEYVTIPGIGRSSDYIHGGPEFYAGKIVLVKRGTTTFEEKIRIALKEKGAAGIIIYNNVSGIISMSVGADVGAACSISQDDGEKLAAQGTGTIKISKSQIAGPFMSTFSSWGPTSDLQIKPEITGHGGEILSAIPGQGYDRLSGTSMACPNVAGATALIRQYVKEGHFGDLSTQEVTAVVNQLMMSTADIIRNKNGLPAAVRKQGAGLVNIGKATSSLTYITTTDKDGNVMDKTKLELGDDKNKTGVYTMSFTVHNFGSNAVTYNIGGIVVTEGVSPTYTSHGDNTVTMEGYHLSGAQTTVQSVSGSGSASGNTVTVNGNANATITVEVRLSDEDKAYLNQKVPGTDYDGDGVDDKYVFPNGMYVEGFIQLDAQGASDIDMNVPMLAFYGDWTQAPIFDEEYYDTNKDEVNKGLNDEDKLMADAYATRVIGKLYTDYIATLGSYYFVQDPSANQIAADKDHIAISNQESDGTGNYTVCGINSINAGLLRNVKELHISIVDLATGKEIYNQVSYNQRKSYSSGGTIYASSIDVDFSALEHELKNNTKYEVTVTTYIDYGTNEEQKNERNTFSFPLYIDFQAPALTDVNFRTEYDKSTKKTKLFADLNIYDNHYAMGVQVGQIVPADEDSQYTFEMESFGKYVTPVYSTYNSTTKVTIELTDYVSKLKNSAGLDHASGSNDVVYNNNSFIVTCYDYAMNVATYEVRLPDEVMYLYFGAEEIQMSPNETLDISTILNIYPNDSWIQILDFTTSDDTVADVVNQTIVAKKSGEATITATGYNKKGEAVTASTKIKVLATEDPGYVGGYTEPSVNLFEITGYETIKAYYSTVNEEREIGITGGSYEFKDNNLSLSMFPSESVKLTYMLDSYSPDDTEVTYSVGRTDIASVDESGTIVANAKGTTVVFITVKFKGQNTLYSARVNITVKDPFTTNSIYLMSYKGNGGEVVIPSDRGITTIYSYAFSNYEYVDKDLSAGDVIDEEDPYYIKQQYIGEDTITKVVIPEGVTTIEAYAFAGLTALEEVVFPTTLTKIGLNAFYGCTSLKTLSTKTGDTVLQNNLDYVKFINKKAFADCVLEEVSLKSIVAIGDYAFENCRLNYLELPASSQSIGAYAFMNNEALSSIIFAAPKVKIGPYAFVNCTALSDVTINASVISPYAFYNCQSLSNVTLGREVAVIGEFAFVNTALSTFNIDARNSHLKVSDNGVMLLNKEGNEVILVAPNYSGTANTITLDAGIDTIRAGAFAGNKRVFRVIGDGVKYIAANAFDSCTNLGEAVFSNLQTVGDYAFYNTALTQTPNLSAVATVGKYAFGFSKLTSVTVGDNANIGDYAFSYNPDLKTVTVGNGVTVGEGAFYCPVVLNTYEETGSFSLNYYTPYTYEVKDASGNVVETYYYYTYDFTTGTYSNLNSLTIGKDAVIGDYAFFGNGKLQIVTLGDGAKIGNYAFYNNASLSSIDLSKVITIGDYAFAGSTAYEFSLKDNAIENVAFEREWINGEVVIKNYRFTGFAPALTAIDLSSVESLGIGAFSNNKNLSSVTFTEQVNSIPKHSFYGCISLTDVTLPANVTEIGEYAFGTTGMKNINLSGIKTIGSYAFAFTNLQSIELCGDAVIGDYTFAYCYHMTDAQNLNLAVEIGDYAFNNTALTSVTLTNAQTIGSYAFAESDVTEVVFGNALTALGENPFYACAVESYGKYENIIFHQQVIGTELVETYDISATVRVINGVLYQVVANGGLELVSYPMAKDTLGYVVENGTVRISAHAFAGSNIKNVTFPISLISIGDKAMYDCDKLGVVVFTSYEAPRLEEAYDTSYLTYENMPFTGKVSGYEGLGISKYYMWNVASYYNNFYFGANFVDYIGHLDNNLVMVKPQNGQRYDSMILGQYFATVVEGANAPITATLEVIAMIDALPVAINLSHEELVVAARKAYDLLPSIEQKALVTNYDKLTNAEDTITFLKMREEGNAPADPTPEKPNAFLAFLANYYWILIIAVVVIAGAVTVTVILVKRKKKSSDPETDEAIPVSAEAEADEVTPAEEAAEETEEVVENEENSAEEGAESQEEASDAEGEDNTKTSSDSNTER